jgi:hypothetical protein
VVAFKGERHLLAVDAREQKSGRRLRADGKPSFGRREVGGLAEQLLDAGAHGGSHDEGNLKRGQPAAGFYPRDRLAGDARSVGEGSLGQAATKPGEPQAVVYPAGRADPDVHPNRMPRSQGERASVPGSNHLLR